MIARVLPMIAILAATLVTACDCPEPAPGETDGGTAGELAPAPVAAELVDGVERAREVEAVDAVELDEPAPTEPLGLPDILEPPPDVRLGNPDASFDMACFGPLGHLGRCFVACNQWNWDGSLWSYGGPIPCRFACVDLKTQHVLSCGHYCDDADDCWLAYFDQDLIVYPGEPIPASLVGVIEDVDPYADVPIASAWFGGS